MVQSSLRSLIKRLSIVLFALLPANAYANDLSEQYLAEIFGRVGSVLIPAVPTTSMFSSMYYIFNIAVLTIGSIVLTYVAVVSSVQTAQEGEIMGKKWSSIWLPIRSVLGISLLIPSSGGYCLAQVIMMSVILQSVGLANKIWDVVLNNYETGNTLTSGTELVNIQQSSEAFFRGAMCAAHFEFDDMWKSHAGDITVMGFGPFGNTYCGSIVLGQAKDPNTGLVDSLKTALLQAFEEGLLRTLFNSTLAAYRYEFAPQPALAPGLPKIYYYAPLSPTDAEMALFQAQYDAGLILTMPIQREVWTHTEGLKEVKALISATYDAINRNTNIVTPSTAASMIANSAREYGWLFTGAFYNTLARANNVSKIKFAFIMTFPQINMVFSDNPEFMRPFIIRDAIYKAFQSDINPSNGPGGSLGNLGYSSSGAMSFYQDTFGAIFTSIGHSFMRHMTTSVQINGRADPLLSMADFGMSGLIMLENLWFTSLIVAFGIMLGACIMTGLSPACHPVAAAAKMIIGMVTWFVAALYGGMCLLGIYVPMVPFMTFTFAAFQWFLLVIEAMTAAPIVALGLAAPSQEQWGKAGIAIILSLNLFLRPSLMMIGFVASVRLMYTVFDAFNYSFGSTLASQIGNVGLFGIVAVVVMYGMISASLVTECFSLIYILPDRVIRWIGGSVESTGQQVQNLAQQTKGKFDAGVKTGSEAIQAASKLASKAVDGVASLAGEGGGGGGLEAEGGGDEDPGGGGGGGGDGPVAKASKEGDKAPSAPKKKEGGKKESGGGGGGGGGATPPPG